MLATVPSSAAPATTEALLAANRQLRQTLAKLEARRHFVDERTEVTLRRCADAEFAAATGVGRRVFYFAVAQAAPHFATAGDGAFGVGAETAVLLLLLHARAPRNYPKDPLRSTTLRRVADALDRGLGLQKVSTPDNPLLVAAKAAFSDVVKDYRELPRLSNAAMRAATVSDLLNVDPDAWPTILKKSSLNPDAATDRFRWSPSFSTHPIFEEKGRVNMHRINKRAALLDENEILEFFIKCCSNRFKLVSFNGLGLDSAGVYFCLNQDLWRRHFGVDSVLFSWLLSCLVNVLTPKLEEAGSLLYYAADTKLAVFLEFLTHSTTSSVSGSRHIRDVVDRLLLDRFSSPLSRKELCCIILQVRFHLGAVIFSNPELKYDVHALAFEGIFGKFNYIYDTISHLLGHPFEIPMFPPSELSEEEANVAEERTRIGSSTSAPATTMRGIASTSSNRRVSNQSNSGIASSSTKDATKQKKNQQSTIKPSTNKKRKSNNNNLDDDEKEQTNNNDKLLEAISNPFAITAVRRASGIVNSMKRPVSSSPPSAIKDIREWRNLLASEGESITLDECEPITLVKGLFSGDGAGGNDTKFASGMKRRISDSDEEEEEEEEEEEDELDEEDDGDY